MTKSPERTLAAPEPDELLACLALWEASEGLPPMAAHEEAASEINRANGGGVRSASTPPGSETARGFTEAVREAWLAAENTLAGSVPIDLLEAYLPVDAAAPDAAALDVATPGTVTGGIEEWVTRGTGATLAALADQIAERFLLVRRRPLAAFTPQEIDETFLTDTPVSEDGSIVASVVKRGGQLLLRLQSQNAVLKDQILAVLLPHSPSPDEPPGLVFVAMAATGVGNWSVGWSRISEAERDALMPDGRVQLRPVPLADQESGLFPLLSLSAAEEANVSIDPLARSVWEDWMERWSRSFHASDSP